METARVKTQEEILVERKLDELKKINALKDQVDANVHRIERVSETVNSIMSVSFNSERCDHTFELTTDQIIELASSLKTMLERERHRIIDDAIALMKS